MELMCFGSCEIPEEKMYTFAQHSNYAQPSERGAMVYESSKVRRHTDKIF